MDAQKFAADLGITMQTRVVNDNPLIDPNPQRRRMMHHYEVHLTCDARETSMVFLFSTGANQGAPPSLEQVLEALAMDAALVENDELPLDDEDEHNVAVRAAAVAQTEELKHFLGGWYEPFVYGDRE